ncbi:MAG: ribonuclease III [Acidobacteriota bacterium]|jgi:ribonuclease-3
MDERREAALPAPVAELEARIGYVFGDTQLALRALSHSSLNSEKRIGRDVLAEHNEQLEFLGDAVLGFIVSEYLLRSYPDLPEGQLSIHKSRIVSAAHLVSVAQSIHLGACLQIGRGEELSGGRHKRALLADAVEAVLAAIYLDGGLEPARRFVENIILTIATAANDSTELRNFKALLQAIVQQRGLPQPVYQTIQSDGPEHAKTFTVEVRVGPGYREQATGATKKAAGQLAARKLFERLVAAA